MLRAGDVISKSELTERLYEQDFERDSNVIEVFIGRLRKKLDPDNTLRPIETLRGRGYRFALRAQETVAESRAATACPRSAHDCWFQSRCCCSSSSALTIACSTCCFRDRRGKRTRGDSRCAT